jgi:16S rRNA (guanine527-N7)-methyltransferase
MSDVAGNWDDASALSGASRDRLELLTRLLQKWNPAINLVAKSSLVDVWQRHIADSAQIFAFRPPAARVWLDIGSGGGFPGLVVAVLAQDLAPELRVELVDSDQRKCVFLQTAVQALGLSVTVTRSRIEALTPRGADVVSARALAPLDQLCRYALPHLAPGGICLLLKGAAIEAELADARKSFNFNVKVSPSVVDGAGVVVQIGDLAHV